MKNCFDNKQYKILVTGANGYVGSRLIKKLKINNFSTYGLMRNIGNNDMENNNCEFFRNDYYITNKTCLDNIDILIHLAFARRFRSNAEIADSLSFSKNIFETAKNKNVKRILNISTIGVYENTTETITESSAVGPDSIYGMAKYANEIVLDSIVGKTNTKFTNLRVCGIAENQNLLPAFIKNAYENGRIDIWGGQQRFSWLDIDDVTDAIIMLLKVPLNNWKNVYNLGLNNINYNIVDIANIVAQRMKERFNKIIKINIVEEKINFQISIDSNLFISDTGWNSKYNLIYTIDKIIDEYLNSKK